MKWLSCLSVLVLVSVPLTVPSRPPLSLPLKGSSGALLLTHTLQCPESMPAACFLGISARVQWGARSLQLCVGRQALGQLSGLPLLPVYFREAGGWGGCSQPCGPKWARPCEGLSSHQPHRPEGSAIRQLSSVVTETCLSWNVILLGGAGLGGQLGEASYFIHISKSGHRYAFEKLVKIPY